MKRERDGVEFGACYDNAKRGIYISGLNHMLIGQVSPNVADFINEPD
jgi:hypothetical protein